MTPPATATARLATIRLRHPVRNEPAHIFDLEAWAETARRIARERRRIDVVHVVQSIGETSAPDVNAHVVRVAAGFRGEARREHGRSWRWAGLATALALVMGWLDAVTGVVTALTMSGGVALSVIVGSVPVVFAARKSWRHAIRARDFGQVAAVLLSARVRRATIIEGDAGAVDQFGTENLPALAELDRIVTGLADGPLDASARGAALALTLSRAATRCGLAPVGEAYHRVYTVLTQAEMDATRAEQNGGMFADTRVRRTLRRASEAVNGVLSPYRVIGGVRTSPIAPLIGAVTGLLALGLSASVTGLYNVAPDTAVIIVPPTARLGRLLEASGINPRTFGLEPELQEVARLPGLAWTWPPPFVDRRAVALGDQYTAVRSVVMQTGPDTFSVVQIRLRFRIVDLNRWAQYDRTGSGAMRLGRALSEELQGRLEYVGRDLVQRASRDPALAQNPRLLTRQVEQVMVMQLPAMISQFGSAINNADAVREAGVRIDSQIRPTDVQLDRSATSATAGMTVAP